MHFTKRTYYGVGIVAAACNMVGSVVLLFGYYTGFLLYVGTVGAAGMMLFLAARHTDKMLRYTSLGAAALAVGGMIPGAVGSVCGALAWPLFALPYFVCRAEDTPCKTVAGLTLLAGAVQLVGSFISLPDTLRICIAVFIAVTQGVLAWVLFCEEPKEAS